MSENSPSPPLVEDKRLKPTGVVPKNIQAWVLVTVALMMMIIITFSGRQPRKERGAATPTPPPAAMDPSAARIQEYQQRIDEQARRLQREQAQLAQMRRSLPPSNSLTPATPYYAGSGQPLTPQPADDFVVRSTVLDSDERSYAREKRKREYESLFASNVVLSYRKAVTAPGPFPSMPGSRKAGLAPDAPALDAGPFDLEASNPLLAAARRFQRERPPPVAPLADTGTRQEPKDQQESEIDPQLQNAEGKKYRLFEGTMLETVLTNRLDGHFSGPVNCMVTTNIYSHNGRRLLIPQGSRALGEVRRVETFGQQRLAVFFHRVIMPDGYSLSLDQFKGLNQLGETGLRDRVNHHYLQLFGASLAIGAIAGFSQANTRYGFDTSGEDAYRQGVAGSLSQSSLRILDRYLNVLPTFTIREGHRVKVYLSNDLLLPAYEKHQLPSDL